MSKKSFLTVKMGVNWRGGRYASRAWRTGRDTFMARGSFTSLPGAGGHGLVQDDKGKGNCRAQEAMGSFRMTREKGIAGRHVAIGAMGSFRMTRMCVGMGHRVCKKELNKGQGVEVSDHLIPHGRLHGRW